MRLLTGRLGWVVGALVLFVAAPLLEGVFREVAVPVERARLRAQTTGRAEGRIVSTGFRLAVDEARLATARDWEEATRARPFAVLAFPGPLGEEVRSLYRPAGDRRIARPAGRLGEDLLVFPPDLAPGLPAFWTPPAAGRRRP